jgi:hypothetical protein
MIRIATYYIIHVLCALSPIIGTDSSHSVAAARNGLIIEMLLFPRVYQPTGDLVMRGSYSRRSHKKSRFQPIPRVS